MKLYGSFTSPYVRHCRIALIEEAFDCEFCEADNTVSARLSPMQKVPFAIYHDDTGEQVLSDSTTIIKFIRQQNNKSFLENVDEMNRYLAATTLLDSAINLFFLEKDGITPEQSSYLARQQARIETGLNAFEQDVQLGKEHLDEADLRLACFLDWGLFRNRLTLAKYPRLKDFLLKTKDYAPFADTSPE